jgi:hypothetical protein
VRIQLQIYFCFLVDPTRWKAQSKLIDETAIL